MPRFHRRVGIAVALIVAASSGLAQQAPAGSNQAVQESASATVVEIPVNVVGKDGKPVAGLKAEDFELYDDGKRQPISTVEVIDLSRRLDASKPESIPAAARRLWLLVFDLTYTSPSGLLRARDGARQFVTAAMSPNDLAAVGTLSIDRGWKLLVNFTRDRRQLGWAIDTLGLKGESLATSDPLSFAFTPPDWDSRGGSSFSSNSKGLSLEDLKDLQTIQKKANDDYARGRVNHLMNTLAGIGRTLDSVRGRKHVLYFSEGFETRLLSGTVAGGGRNASLMQESNAPSVANSSPQDTANAAISGEIWKVDSDARFGSSSMRGQLTDSLGLFNRSDAVLDAIDISGLRAEGDVSSGKPGSGTDALFALASATDGDLVSNANQLGGELQKLEERTALVYLLVYQPKQLAKPGAFHALKIKTRAASAKITARSGYYEPRPFKSLSPFERLLASGDLVTGGSRGNDISGSLLAMPFASNADLPQVPVLLEIPGAALLADDTGAQSAVQIYVYANDASGSLADYIATEMSLDLSKLRPTLESSGIKFYGTLYLPTGDYAVRALVRNGTTGRSGVFATSFQVPAMPGGAPTLLPPLFQEAPGRWLMVRGNPRADAPPRPADYPFAVAGQSFIPSVVPTLAAGGEATVTLVAYNFPPSLKPAPLDVRAQIVGADGKEWPAEVVVSSRSDVERGGGRKLLLAFKPQGLSPGRYTLKVAVSDPVSKSRAESGGFFEVK